MRAAALAAAAAADTPISKVRVTRQVVSRRPARHSSGLGSLPDTPRGSFRCAPGFSAAGRWQLWAQYQQHHASSPHMERAPAQARAACWRHLVTPFGVPRHRQRPGQPAGDASGLLQVRTSSGLGSLLEAPGGSTMFCRTCGTGRLLETPHAATSLSAPLCAVCRSDLTSVSMCCARAALHPPNWACGAPCSCNVSLPGTGLGSGQHCTVRVCPCTLTWLGWHQRAVCTASRGQSISCCQTLDWARGANCRGDAQQQIGGAQRSTLQSCHADLARPLSGGTPA